MIFVYFIMLISPPITLVIYFGLCHTILHVVFDNYTFAGFGIRSDCSLTKHSPCSQTLLAL